MPTPFSVEHRNIPTVGLADYQVEGHVFGPVVDDASGPWLAHLVIHGIRKRGVMGFGRDALAALLAFVAEHDPDMYQRMGVQGHRARGRRQARDGGGVPAGEGDQGPDQDARPR